MVNISVALTWKKCLYSDSIGSGYNLVPKYKLG